MAFQQSQVVCAANSWTSLCQFRQLRKSLLIQCPQVANVTSFSVVSVPDSTVETMVAADMMRRNFLLSTNAATGVIVSTDSSSLASELLGFTVTPSSDINAGPFFMDLANFNQWVQSQWFGYQNSGSPAQVGVWTERYGCVAIVLATAKAAAVSGGPFGSQPPGYWRSGNLNAGPADFRLQQSLDGDVTLQQWYAWPIGASAVNVTVTESFDVADDAPDTYLTVQLPTLGADAKKYLLELQEKILGAQQQASGAAGQGGQLIGGGGLILPGGASGDEDEEPDEVSDPTI